MEAIKALSDKLFAHRENVVHVLLLGSFVALGFRSSEQQKEIDALEAEKAKLRSENAANSAAMWSVRESLFRLSEEESGRPVIISASRLRAIYGEEEPAAASSVDVMGVGANEAESVSIA
ncbi:hypothetical protein LUZ60_013859 [Juncus effusus]|nr:hypothetical protein LUZ60_013859 [Juncus effusus]